MMTNRRDFGNLMVVGGAAVATSREILLLAQQSVDYSSLVNWFNANPASGSAFDQWNVTMVPYFNNINNYTWSPSDFSGMANSCWSIGNYFSQTGTPTLDSCTQCCVLANVPSPGSASQVLFTNPTRDNISSAYTRAQSYGYSGTCAQFGTGCSAPNITTWDSSNGYYSLCSNTSSSYFNTAGGGFQNAASAYQSYLDTGVQGKLPPQFCAALPTHGR